MTETTGRIPVTAVNDHGSFDVFADYDPAIAAGHARVLSAARRRGVLDQLTYELGRLRNAELQGCNL